MDNNNIPEIEKVNYSLEDIAVEKLEKTQRKLNKFSSVNMEDPVIQEIDNTIDTIKSLNPEYFRNGIKTNRKIKIYKRKL